MTAWDMMNQYLQMVAEEEELTEKVKSMEGCRNQEYFKLVSCLNVLRFELLVLEFCLRQNAFTKEEQEAVREELEHLRNQYYPKAM